MGMMTEQELQLTVQQLRSLSAEVTRGNEDAMQVFRALEPGLQTLYKDLGIGADGTLPTGAWEQVSADRRIEMIGRLEGALRALRASMAGIDEPKDRDNFMFRVHASNSSIYVLVAGSIIVTALLLWGIHQYWIDATAKGALEVDILRMVILMGALGGTVHWMSSLVNYIGNGNFMRRWIPYYVLAPFQGAALALLVYLLLRVGVLAVPADESPAKHLNLIGLYAFGGLTGLFAKQAIEMLRDVFNAMFKRVDAKDASTGVRAPTPSANGAKPAGS